MSPLAAYDPRLSWEQNLENAPPVASMPASTADPLWSFLGLPVASPLGVAAGPLLCGQWLLHYASLGYDILTWKTVRSQAHPCYAPPNLVPVRCGPLTQSGTTVPTAEHMQGSWAVSFGMPSVAPRVWIEDIRSTRRQLPPEKLLVVSVVGTQPATARLDDLADDYARCAVWAAEAGADVVEMNFSCPNVSSVDGQLFQHPRDAAFVAARVRQEVPDKPLIAKIGHVPDDDLAAQLIRQLDGHISALSMTNSIPATVQAKNGRPLFDGSPRGICGSAILDESIRQVRRFAALIDQHNATLRLIGVGGIATPADALRYLAAGAESIQLATAAITAPHAATEIRRALPAGPGRISRRRG